MRMMFLGSAFKGWLVAELNDNLKAGVRVRADQAETRRKSPIERKARAHISQISSHGTQTQHAKRVLRFGRHTSIFSCRRQDFGA